MALGLQSFPVLVGISYPVKRSPLWSTERHQSTNGKVSTFGRFIYPLYRYELKYEFLRSGIVNQIDAPATEYQKLLAFYNSLHGGADMFVFDDPDDNTVLDTARSIIGNGDGATKDFQLLRAIVNGDYDWSDPVFAPITWLVYIDDVLQVDGVDYVMSDTGVITFSTAPVAAASITWSGTYKWICLFDDDSQDFEKFMQNLYELKAIKFTTQKINSLPVPIT